MSYTTLKFLFFVGVVVFAYFLFPAKKYRWTVLLAASYYFYLLAGYRYAAFILFTTAATYLSALWLDSIARNAKDVLNENKKTWDREQKKAFKAQVQKRKRWIVTLTLVTNFGILVFLKYYNFFAGSLNDLLGGMGHCAVRSHAAADAASGHFLLHLPVHGLCGGCVPGKGNCGA